MSKALAEARQTRIFLVRHGESEGNIDPQQYIVRGDHGLRLTPRGIAQAQAAGRFLSDYLAALRAAEGETFGRLRLWFSDYYRTRETARHILPELAEVFDFRPGGEASYERSNFLIERRSGLYDGLNRKTFKELYPDAAAYYEKHQRNGGASYAPSPLGESRLDVVVRVKPFFGTIAKDRVKSDIRNIGVVSHGMTVRAFVAGWMHYAPEWIEAEMNPGNCWVRLLEGNARDGYVDRGYIFGENAPLGDPAATQKPFKGAKNVFFLKPMRPGEVVPAGVTPIDPLKREVCKL
jgi:broad specificity phosphatase PhoE